jgi:hypothetical protein
MNALAQSRPDQRGSGDFPKTAVKIALLQTEDETKESVTTIWRATLLISILRMARASRSKKSKKPPSPQAERENDNICFTIMPFGGWFDTYYESIYHPAIEAAGLVPRRADDLSRPSAIVHDIWTLTKTATIVLAELSGKNPNVFYELGLAHAIARPAILITQNMDDVPFDLRALRVIVYDRNQPDWGADLKRNIEVSIKETLASPSTAVLPSFLQIDDSRKPSVTTIEKELISLRQDVDLLKRGHPSNLTAADLFRILNDAERHVASMPLSSPPSKAAGLLGRVSAAGSIKEENPATVVSDHEVTKAIEWAKILENVQLSPKGNPHFRGPVQKKEGGLKIASLGEQFFVKAG